MRSLGPPDTGVTAAAMTPITFCLACYGDDDLLICQGCKECYHDRCMRLLSSPEGLYCLECADMLERQAMDGSGMDSSGSPSSTSSDSSSSPSSSSAPSSSPSSHDSTHDSNTTSSSRPRTGVAMPTNTPTDPPTLHLPHPPLIPTAFSNTHPLRGIDLQINSPTAPSLSPPWRKSPSSRYEFRSGAKK